MEIEIRFNLKMEYRYLPGLLEMYPKAYINQNKRIRNKGLVAFSYL